MISVNDLKTGLTLQLDNGLWSVVEFLHVKPGKGAAFVRSKLKNVETGQVIEKTFRAGEKVGKATLDRREMQYLYKEGADYVMMDNETYDQLHLSESQIGDGLKYLKENMNVQVLMHDSRIIGVDIPGNKRVEFSLRYLYGVGPAKARLKKETLLKAVQNLLNLKPELWLTFRSSFLTEM